MKSFKFDTSTPQPEAFFHNICEFLFYIEKYSSSQIEQTLQKIAYSEKIKNKALPNFKDIPDWSRLASKNPQPLNPKDNEKLTPVEKIDNEIIQVIAKGHIALQEPEEKKKPTALKTTKPELPPTKTDPKLAAKTSANPGSAGLAAAKRGPAGKPSTISPSLANKNVATSTLQNKGMPSKLRTQGSGKSLVAQPKTSVNAVPDSQEILKAKMEEVKEELKANDIISKTASETPSDDKKVDENRPKVARFSVQETELVSKHHILEYMNAKKGIKAQVAKLKGDITYYKEKENTTKKKFISRLTSHLDSIQTISQRDYEISLKEKPRWRNAEEGEEEEAPRVEYFTLELRDQRFPRIPVEMMKGLQTAQTVLVGLKKKMTLANEDFRSIVEYSQVFQEEGGQMHPVDKFLRLFKSRFLNDAIQTEMQFLKKEVASYLEKPDIARVMMAAAETWKILNFFEPTEELQRNGIENNPQQQISWLKYVVNNSSNITEIICSKTGFKPSKKAMAGWKDGAKVIEMESSSFQANVLQLFLGYLYQKHPISQDKKGIENIRGANFAHLLKLMRMISIITQGGCRNFPLFMVQANN